MTHNPGQRSSAERDPDSEIAATVDGLIEVVIESLDEKDLEMAAQLLDILEDVVRYLDRDWTLAEWHYLRGRLEWEKEQPEAAIPYFEAAVHRMKDSKERATVLYDLALALFRIGDLVRAEQQFQETIKVAHAYSDALEMMHGYLGLAKVARTKNNAAEAMGWLEQAHQQAEIVNTDEAYAFISEEQRYLLGGLTYMMEMLLYKGELEEVARFLHEAKVLVERMGSAWALAEWHYWQGMLESEKGQAGAAIPHLEKALDGIEDPKKRAVILHNLATALLEVGDLTRAEYKFRESLKLAQEDANTLGAAQGYFGLAEVAYQKNNLSEAMGLLEQARQNAEAIHASDVIVLITNLRGLLYAKVGNLHAASEHYRQLGEEEYLATPPIGLREDIYVRALSALVSNKASLALREGRLEEAQRFAEEAMATQSSLHGGEQVANLVVSGIIATRKGDLALGTQQLLTAFRLAENMSSPDGLLISCLGLSEVYMFQCLFEPAYRVCAVAIDALERLRSHAGDDTDRLHYVQDKMEVYDRIVLLCLILANLLRIPYYLQRALAYTERAKSRTFIELLGRTTNITPPSNLPLELLQKETQVLDQLRALEISMRNSMDVTEQEQMEQAYNEAQIGLDEIWKQIANIAPEYAALRRGQPETFDGVRELLRI
jgi:tetratricopeptide (TPR) repeat protein